MRRLQLRTLSALLGLLLLAACGGAPEATPTQAPTQAPSATAAPPTAAATATQAPSATVAATATAKPTASATIEPTLVPGTVGSLARGKLSDRPFVVMLDNHPDAYPQVGIGHAALVFEALAEFGVTRF